MDVEGYLDLVNRFSVISISIFETLLPLKKYDFSVHIFTYWATLSKYSLDFP